MAKYYKTKYWRIRLVTGWVAKSSADQALVFIYKQDGVGLLTVTLDHRSPRHRRQAHASAQEHPRINSTVSNDKSFRQTWSYTCSGQKIQIRYTCAAPNAGIERAEVDKIVQSLEELELD